MKKKRKILFPCLLLILLLSSGSCIYQNEPLGPNRPPVIVSYEPYARDLQTVIPDTCLFSVSAADPDGDELSIFFYVNDSLASRDDTLEYYAMAPGMYEITCRVMDGGLHVERKWRLKVLDRENRPPVITWYFPEQHEVSAAVGDTLIFHISAEDEEPESLEYIFMRDSDFLSSGSPELMTRFLDRGEYILSGIVWDGQYGDTVQWALTITGFPDTIPPSAVNDLEGRSGDDYGTIYLEWTAPGDDSTYGRACQYIVRTYTYPILTEEDWEQASGKLGEPRPSEAGTREFMEIQNLNPGTYLYVTMRASDDFFNLSPLGNCIKVLVRGFDVGGTVIDALDMQPVEGVIVRAGSIQDTSSSDGTYMIRDLPGFIKSYSARDELVSGETGDYYDFEAPLSLLAQFTPVDIVLVPALELVNAAPDGPYQGNFYFFFREITNTTGEFDRPTVWKNWKRWPIKVYNPPMVYNGVDLQQEARGAMDEWEIVTGLDLFEETSDSLNADAVIIYDAENDGRHHVDVTVRDEDGTPLRKEMWIYFKDTEILIDKDPHLIFTHEFGHIIGLSHSRDPAHLMLGLTKPFESHVTEDEANAVKIIYHLPPILDFSYILDN